MNTVFLLSTGGTIASTANNQGLGIAGALPGKDLITNISLNPDINLRVQSVFQKPSNALTMDDLWVLKNKCQELINSEKVSGIVITHGTDMLEDTAYFLESTLDTKNTSVVVTGSQRVPFVTGTDAYSNLENAIAAAASNATKSMGVLVAFNQSIFSAAHVTKVSSFQLNGFDAPGYGVLGLIDNQKVIIHQKPVRLPNIDIPNVLNKKPTVEIINVYLDAQPNLLQAALDYCDGVVINGVGRGQALPAWVPVIEKATQNSKVILVCSSTLHGPTHQSYDYPASLKDLELAGAIGVSNLSARKARMRLIALMAANKTDSNSIKSYF